MLLLTCTLKWLDLARILRSRDVMLRLVASTVLIGVNWFTYIHAVSTDQVVEASLGYFLTPLVNVMLGRLFLGERLRAPQVASLAIAAAGVALLTSQGNGFPSIAVTLAISFAFYGLMRKTAAVDAAIGLFVETMLLAPVALATLAVLEISGQGKAIAAGPETLGLLALGGLVTTTPLLFFAGAARRLSMATLGFLQYLAPSLQFLLAVAVFGEPFTRRSLASFVVIWIAVALYTIDSVRQWKRMRQKAKEEKGLDCEPTP
jgi:chloramphenicol-sensitive protein RarD